MHSFVAFILIGFSLVAWYRKARKARRERREAEALMAEMRRNAQLEKLGTFSHLRE